MFIESGSEKKPARWENERFRLPSTRKTKTSNEVFVKMDENGNVVGGVLRTVAHTDFLHQHIHAGVGILAIDPETATVYLPKRSSKKDTDPSYLDYSTGEHLKIINRRTGKAETWLQGAKRGLREELRLRTRKNQLLRIPGYRLYKDDPRQIELQTQFVLLISKRKRFFPDKIEIDPSEGGWFKISDLLEVANKSSSNDNPLAGHKLRPMLLQNLQEIEVTSYLRRFLL